MSGFLARIARRGAGLEPAGARPRTLPRALDLPRDPDWPAAPRRPPTALPALCERQVTESNAVSALLKPSLPAEVSGAERSERSGAVAAIVVDEGRSTMAAAGAPEVLAALRRAPEAGIDPVEHRPPRPAPPDDAGGPSHPAPPAPPDRRAAPAEDAPAASPDTPIRPPTPPTPTPPQPGEPTPEQPAPPPIQILRERVRLPADPLEHGEPLDAPDLPAGSSRPHVEVRIGHLELLPHPVSQAQPPPPPSSFAPEPLARRYLDRCWY